MRVSSRSTTSCSSYSSAAADLMMKRNGYLSNVEQDSTTELRQQLEKRLSSCSELSESINRLDTEITHVRQQIEATSECT